MPNQTDEEKLRRASAAAADASTSLGFLRIAVIQGIAAGLNLDTMAGHLGALFEQETTQHERLVRKLLEIQAPHLTSVPPAPVK